jgi:hypothetical protein
MRVCTQRDEEWSYRLSLQEKPDFWRNSKAVRHEWHPRGWAIALTRLIHSWRPIAPPGVHIHEGRFLPILGDRQIVISKTELPITEQPSFKASVAKGNAPDPVSLTGENRTSPKMSSNGQ